MKRFALAAVLAALVSSQADAQYYTPSYYASPTRYFPGTVGGYYAPQYSSFGNIYYNNGVVPANAYLPGTAYYNGVVPANTFGPGYLYGDTAYYNTGYYSPTTYSSTYYAPAYTGYRSGLYRRGWGW